MLILSRNLVAKGQQFFKDFNDANLGFSSDSPSFELKALSDLLSVFVRQGLLILLNLFELRIRHDIFVIILSLFFIDDIIRLFVLTGQFEL